LAEEGIVVLAISPDPPEILARFAERCGVEFPLLSDTDSRVIRAWGLFNDQIEPDHAYFGVPHSGVFLVDDQGIVFDKHLGPDHRIRESVANAVQERFGLDTGHKGVQLDTGHGLIRAWLTAPTIRPQQLNLLTVEIEIPPGEHIYGEPLPEGYVSLTLELAVKGDLLIIDDIRFPSTRIQHLVVLEEDLPVYEGTVTIKVICRGLTSKSMAIDPTLKIRFQACDEALCHAPQDHELRLSLRAVPHDWNALD